MPKPQRNSPCPCGSGLKFKRCCGKAGKAGGTPAATARKPSSSSPSGIAPRPNVEQPPYITRPSTPGRKGERVVFINSIGGLGDSVPIPVAIRLYKKFYPQDTTILHDSLFYGHYFEKPPYIDEIHRASEQIFANYAPETILKMDPSLPRHGGIPLPKTRFTRFVSTHHAHGRRFQPEDVVVKMDWATVLADVVSGEFEPFEMRLKAEHLEQVDQLFEELNPDGRPLFAIQNRGRCPYGTMQKDSEVYLRELTEIAETLTQRYNARILLCGDEALPSETRYASGDWIDLDARIANAYYKLDILRRCDLMLAAPSGFSWVVNLTRGLDQTPPVMIYAGERVFSSADLVESYPNYVANGGGTNNNMIGWTFRHPDLSDFIFDTPHTPEKVLAFVERLLSDRELAPAPTSVPSGT